MTERVVHGFETVQIEVKERNAARLLAALQNVPELPAKHQPVWKSGEQIALCQEQGMPALLVEFAGPLPDTLLQVRVQMR